MGAQQRQAAVALWDRAERECEAFGAPGLLIVDAVLAERGGDLVADPDGNPVPEVVLDKPGIAHAGTGRQRPGVG